MDNSGTPTARVVKTFDKVVLDTNCEPVVVMPPMAKFSDFINVHSSTRTPIHIPNVVHSIISRMTNACGVKPNTVDIHCIIDLLLSATLCNRPNLSIPKDALTSARHHWKKMILPNNIQNDVTTNEKLSSSMFPSPMPVTHIENIAYCFCKCKFIVAPVKYSNQNDNYECYPCLHYHLTRWFKYHK